jgi:hypothetical protein
MTNISCPCWARALFPCQVAGVLRTSKSDLGVRRAKGGAFQWVQAPPGIRSSRKQSEQSWR